MEQLDAKLQSLRTAVIDEMREVLQSGDERPELFNGMMHYHMGWVDQSLEPAIVQSGKLIRPILTLLTCQAVGEDWRKALPAAASIEISHNFTLVHDDIQDNSPTRRGRPTLWTIWGIPQAINTGDAMFASAQLSMTNLFNRGVDPTAVVKASHRLNETFLELTRGQFNDMSFENRAEVSVEDYLEMIKGKTSVLIALACELGALVGGAKTEIVSHYAQYGLAVGLAFQVIDDILGIWGDEDSTGKSAESDILTKKKTLPVLYGLAQSQALRDHYQLSGESPEFVATTIQLLEEVGARAYAEAQAEYYSNLALEQLKLAQPKGESAEIIYQLTQFLLQRGH